MSLRYEIVVLYDGQTIPLYLTHHHDPDLRHKVTEEGGRDGELWVGSNVMEAIDKHAAAKVAEKAPAPAQPACPKLEPSCRLASSASRA